MANNYKKTIVLGLDYSEFSGGISECNRKMGLLDSEMKLASEQAKGFGNETDQLRIKQEGLTQKIELQKKIVEQQAQAYDKAMTKYNGTGKEVDRLDKALLDSRTTLQKYENQLKDTTEELENTGDETEVLGEKFKTTEGKTASLGDVIRALADFLHVSGNPIVESFASQFDGLNSKIAFAALKVGSLVGAFTILTVKTADHAKEIEITSQKLGMATDQYQVWDYILKSVGSSAADASGDFAGLAEKARDAAEGGEESAKLFKILGVRLKDNEGNLRTQGELFNDIVFGLRKLNDETDRNAIASELLGQTGEDLVPILNSTGEEFKALAQKAYETGNVMDEATLGKFSDLNENMQEFRTVIEGLASKGAEVMLPLLTALFDALSLIPVPVLQTFATVLAGFGIFKTVFEPLTKLPKGIKNARDAFREFNPAALRTKGIVIGVASAVLLLLGAFAVLTDRGNIFKDTISEIGNTVSQIQASTNQVRYHARGTDYFEGGQTWVGEEGAELVTLPRGSKITPHRESMRAAKGSGGNTYIFNIQADQVEDFNRLVRLANEERTAFRAGKARI